MRQRGFTLIELLLVIAIIVILVALVVAVILTSRIRAQDARLKADLKQLRVLAESYQNQNNSYTGWDVCVADPEPTGFTCADDAGLASSVETLTDDIEVRQPDGVTTEVDNDRFCMSLTLLSGNVACADSSGQFKTDLLAGFSCENQSEPVCPGGGAPAGGGGPPQPPPF